MEKLEEFNMDMHNIVELIRTDDSERARTLFNSEIFPKYKNTKSTDTNNPLSKVILFFYDLDEFLNNPASKKFRPTYKEEIIKSYFSDFIQDQESSKKDINIVRRCPSQG